MKRAIAVSHRFFGMVNLLLIAAVLGLSHTAAHADATNLCVPMIGGLAGPPVIDGVVGSFNQPIDNDLGWNNAVQVNLSADSGATRSATMQVGRTATDFNISFSVGAPTPGFDNTIVLAFSTDGNSANDWRIHITPFDNSTVNTNGVNLPPFTVTYWRDSGGWNNAGAMTFPSTMLNGRVKYSRTGGTGTGSGYWEIEIQIPIETNPANANGASKIYFPASGTFGFYADVLNTSFVAGTVVQDPWPAATQIVSGAGSALEQNTPGKGGWGTLSFNTRPVCDDVSITQADVGVKDPTNPSVIITNMRTLPPGIITNTFADCQNDTIVPNNFQWPATQGPTNTFVAKPQNNMSTPANAVSAKFYIANWGIPGPADWSPIGDLKAPTPPAVANNPTAAASIPSGSTGDLTSTWNLSYRQACLYQLSNNAHHCIHVELESTDPATVFSTKSVERNMDFVPASVFTRDAEISVRGRGKAPEGRHQVLLFVDAGVQYYAKAEKGAPFIQAAAAVKQCRQGLRYPEFRLIPASAYPNGVTEALVYIVRGYLRTDCVLTINRRKYACARGIGNFGYVAGHNGPVQTWRSWIEGNGVKMLEGGVYLVPVPEEGSVKVRTTLTAVGRGDKDPGAQKLTSPGGSDSNVRPRR